jgi:hypothetical protein
MTTLKTFTISDIRSWKPCHDPARWLPAGQTDWRGTALDVLRHPKIPPADKLWCVLREDCIDARTLRLFAVWCAREALKLVAQPDPRSVAACDVAERYANGLATADEMAAAWAAAWAASRDADLAAAWAAAWAASRDADLAAAWAAAWARDAAWDAARARDAAWASQVAHLERMSDYGY